MSDTPRPPATQSYQGQQVALLTQHGKERVMAPVLAQHLGLQLVHVQDYDTDLLGTFTRDIDREGSQLDAARRKSELGMDLSGLTLGLASEGAFGPDPFTGFLPWDTEVVVFHDRSRKLEVVGMAQGSAQSVQRQVNSLADLLAFAAEAGFPSHHLVLRPQDEHHPAVRKGLATVQDLTDAWSWGVAQASNAQVWVENDLRAHTNPTRMVLIEAATRDLVHKLASPCPACASPGFAPASRVPGLPCAACGRPTLATKAEVWACPSCHYQLEQPAPGPRHADPSRCDHCNP